MRFALVLGACTAIFLAPIRPKCTCACCVAVIPSVPSQVSDDRPTRCATPPEVSGRRCMDQYEVVNDSILASASRNDLGQALVDYDRYCFLECRPQEGTEVQAGIDMTCIALTPEDVQAAKTLDGNGKEVR